jgi:ABC-type antimicrobial peptide transport system permease subunit
VAGAVIRDGVRLALAGIAIGLAAAFVLSRFLESLVFGIATTDPLTYIGVAVLLVGVAGVAAFVPARRATRVDPVQSLRAE